MRYPLMEGGRSNSVRFSNKMLLLAHGIVTKRGKILRRGEKKVFVSICINAYRILVELPCYPRHNIVVEFCLGCTWTWPLSWGNTYLLFRR